MPSFPSLCNASLFFPLTPHWTTAVGRWSTITHQFTIPRLPFGQRWVRNSSSRSPATRPPSRWGRSCLSTRTDLHTSPWLTPLGPHSPPPSTPSHLRTPSPDKCRYLPSTRQAVHVTDVFVSQKLPSLTIPTKYRCEYVAQFLKWFAICTFAYHYRTLNTVQNVNL